MKHVEHVDLLVIGSGKAGKTLAMDLAKAGKRVVLVEREMIGGSCINVACIPTKSLITSARSVRLARRAEQLGVLVEGARIDLDRLREHKTGVVAGMIDANLEQFKKTGVELVLGTARFVSKRTVAVQLTAGGTRRIRGRHVVIDTGSRPVVPDIPGLRAARPWTSNIMVSLPELPERLIILGGGSIGVEAAQMLAAFGSRVTIIEHAEHLLPREDDDVADAITGILRRDGVTVRPRETVEWVDRDETGIQLRLVDGDLLTADEILVAVGREPVTKSLNLHAAKVQTTDEGYIWVDEHLRTSAEQIWAAGDVAGSPQFTHASLDDYRIIKTCMAGNPRSTRDRLIPYTVFTTPELGRVGLTEQQAVAAGHTVVTATMPVAQIPRARTMRETDGFWKAVVDADTSQILGVALLGPQAGETITTVQCAMLAGRPYTDLRDAIITHPTMTEGLNLLFSDDRFGAAVH